MDCNGGVNAHDEHEGEEFGHHQACHLHELSIFLQESWALDIDNAIDGI
jgi:hypothetical protein